MPDSKLTLLLACVMTIGISRSLLSANSDDVAKAADGKELTLWYTKPAQEWTEALPLGNGRMGAMVYGGVPEERLQLNEETIWTGKPRSYAHIGAYKHLATLRKMLQEMRVAEREGADKKKIEELQSKAETLAGKEFMADPLTQASYQPMADLFLDFPTHTQVDHYRRELDLTTGRISVTYDHQGTRYTRESFASYPDNSIVTRISASEGGTVSCKIRLAGPYPSGGKKVAAVEASITSITDTGMVLAGRVAQGTTKEENDGVIRFEVHLQVSTTGGEIVKESEGLAVRGARSLTIKLVAASNFKDYKTVDADPAKRCRETLASVQAKTCEDMYRTHLDDYQRLFGRASLSLPKSKASALPTDQRIVNFTKSKDYDLVALIFHYGRYLAISGSRKGCQPLNLLGIWTLRPAWGCKYTCNINIEMNYWPMNPTNLPECNMPLFDTLEKLAESGSITAKEHYNAGGWVLHHNWDLWLGTAPLNKASHGTWVTGSGWMVHHIWEHFLFTGDLEVLKKYYPVLKGAVQFYTEYLYEDEITGYLISGPSNSPEHGGIVMGPTIDHQIIRSLFKAFVQASRLVGDKSELPAKAAKMISRIAPNMKGKENQLQEWLEDKDSVKDTHRHLSHLWGVFPGCDITWKDKEMLDAARQSLTFRGDGQTGWSLAWKLNLWARFLDGDHALKILNNHVIPGIDKPDKRAGFYPNLFNANPPFVIDGNFGVCSGVVEMLMQSHILSDVPESGSLSFSDLKFLIHLLPALPTEWKSGSFSGLRARGGFEVAIEWQDGKLKTATIKSLAGNPCQLKVGDQVMDLHLGKGETKKLSF